MPFESMKIMLIVIVFIIFACTILINKIKSNKVTEYDNYDGFVSNSFAIDKLNKSYIINKFNNTYDRDDLVKLFNDSKNPWGITPNIFVALRVLSVLIGIILAIVLYACTHQFLNCLFGIMLSFIGWFYPMYYYKAIAKDREREWNKIYEIIWIIKYTSTIYDSKKVFIETRNYLSSHYPKYKEMIQGFDDFYKYWDPDKIPDYIVKYYNFSIPKELYKIMFNMNETGIYPEQNLNNLKNFSINKHNEVIQKVLGNTPSLATISSLPFLMLSVILAILVPLLSQFLGMV
jgi:hypothetical protein